MTARQTATPTGWSSSTGSTLSSTRRLPSLSASAPGKRQGRQGEENLLDPVPQERQQAGLHQEATGGALGRGQLGGNGGHQDSQASWLPLWPRLGPGHR